MNSFNILSIDPGTTHTGYGLIKADIETLNIHSAKAWSVDASKMIDPQGHDSQLYGERFSRVKMHALKFTSYLNKYKPIVVVSESPFYNPRRPQAFAALLEIVLSIRSSLYEWDPCMQLETIDPSSAKKNIGVKGSSGDKELILSAMRDNVELKQYVQSDLDEHAADALNIGYCQLCRIRQGQI